MMRTWTQQKGFTAIELLVALVAALLISLAAVNVIAAHTTALYTQARTNQSAEEGMEAFALISRLMKQARRSSISITSSADSTTVDLSVPAGFQVWPNITAPYDNNWIRLGWSNTGDNAFQLTVANATSSAALGAATVVPLAGNATGDNTAVAGFTMTDNADGSFLITLATNAGAFDDGDTTFSGTVIPRN